MQAKIEYTARCNLNCMHCSAAMFRPAPEWERDRLMEILNQLISAGYNEFHLQGGEPLIRSDLFDILNLFDENNAVFALSTNSLLLNEEKIDKLLTYKGLLTFTFSLDGATPETHNRMRGDDVFDHAVKMIQHAVKAKSEIAPQKNLSLNHTITKINYHELNDVLKLANTLGVDSITILSLSLLGNALDHKDELFLSEKEEFLAIQKAATLLRKINVSRKIKGLHPLTINMDLFTFAWKCKLMKLSHHVTGKEGGNICGSGTNTIYIALDGTIYPCEGSRVFIDMLEETLGPYERPNINEYTIAEAKETETFKKIVDYLHDYDHVFNSVTPCNTCGYLGKCTICPLFAVADGEVKRCTEEVLSSTIERR
ncbi:MAG: radical SAM protein [Theionarchaea archaeon]|nr:radical SAM protein [Theionarchaea archaeon]